MVSSVNIENKNVSDTRDTAILIEDKDNVIQFVSNAICNLFQIPLKPKDLVGTSMIHFLQSNSLLFEENSYGKALDFLKSKIKVQENSTKFNIRFIDKKEYIIEVYPLHSKDDNFTGNVWLFNSKNELQKEVAINSDDNSLSDLKSKFIAMVSHEFRTPLAAISSSMEIIEILEQQGGNKPISKIAEHISKANLHLSRMTELLDDVLLVNDIENGKLEIHPTNFSLNDLIYELKNEFAYCDFDCHIDLGEKETYILADRRLIKTCLHNLISNAIKYSMVNRIIDIKIESFIKSVNLSIKDYGLGIPSSEQVNIFKSFYRASNVLNIPGSGLGLLIVKSILNMHDAKIHFFSRENIGSEFIIEFPRI